MKELHWLNQRIGKRRGQFIFALFLAVVSSLLYIVFPFLTRTITSLFPTDGTAPSEAELDSILDVLPSLLLILLASQLLRSVVRYIMLIILERVSQNVLAELRLEIYENLCRQDDEFYHTHRTGDLMTRLTGDMDLVRHTIAWLSYNIVESSTLFLFSVCYFFTINVSLTLSMLLLTPLILGSSYLYSKSVRPLFANLRERLSQLNSMAQENIAGNKTIRAFVREDYEIELFEKGNQAYHDANIRANRHWLKFFPVIEGFSQVLTVCTLGLGGYLIIQEQMTLADLTAFTLLTWGISEPMKSLGVYLNDFQRFLTSTSKIMEIYFTQPQISNPINGIKTASEVGTIRFENVSMQYHDGKTATLENISFSLKTGETLGLIGATGSGKTTLVNLITRSIEASSGKIFVDGVNVEDWDLSELRNRVSEATQKVGLHSESVRANISYGVPTLPMEQVRQSAEFAAAHFVDDLPFQYETVIGEMGMGLSGGQKQRIALARALAKKAEILILDDTTSAVDNETERELRENLKKLPYDCTKIIIAQRISAVREADLILVLDKGKVVQSGKHESLSEEKGFYREICQLQGVFAL